MDIQSSRYHFSVQPVAPDIAYFTIVFVNVYFVGEPGGPWVLVDTGLPMSAGLVRRVAEKRYGVGSRPEAIILTHGHFDHAGSALALATEWQAPLYAHPLEMPFLTGRSDYPPQDPTIGGALAFESRFFPHSGYDLGSHVHPLPADGSIPGMPGWRWHHTPGHTAGQVSLFREADRVLLAADALTTMDMDSWSAQITERQEFDRPPAPLTTDWDAARLSIEQLADLNPTVVAAGHGVPIAGSQLGQDLRRLADNLMPPAGGRYELFPARTDEDGLLALPPTVPDPMPKRLIVAAALCIAAAFWVRRQRRD